MQRQGEPGASVRRRCYEILEHGAIGNWKSALVNRLIVLLIVVNLAAITLQSMPEFEARYAGAFAAIEILSLVVFSLEYALRLWVAAEHAGERGISVATARWQFVQSPQSLIDLVAVFPFWFAFVLPSDLRVLLVLRIVRLLKLARYSPGMRSLLEALYAERRALLACVVILFGATLLSATAMHLVERHAQPDKFGTIPDAMWWAIVTLGTIGYGDVVPITALGRIVAAVTIFVGLIMVALPVGIVATAFADQIHRRDFIVNWSMVARVPLFAGLSAVQIAEIMGLLRAQRTEAGDIIVRRGEPAHSMYFIAGGEIEIDLQDKRIRLGVGQFFGESAILRNARRSATVTALQRTSLLVLDARDFNALLHREPRIAERVHAIMRDRVGEERVTPRGDLITEELEESAF